MFDVQRKIKTSVSEWYLVASEKGLRSVLRDRQNISFDESQNLKIKKILDQAEDQLLRYFSGQLKEFTVPLDIQGTDFQKKVWQQLAKIPYGKTCSYQEIAKKIKQPKACRAVGTANGKNPLTIIIPCHRVIASNGSIGGYSGGLPMKVKLLALEGIKAQLT